MKETICVNTWLFIGICAMAALGFVQAAIHVFRTPPEQARSPFE